MHPALTVVLASSLGWSGADLPRIVPADLLVEALAVELSARLGAPAAAAAEAPAPDLDLWYPRPSIPHGARPAPEFLRDLRGDVVYDWRLPVFRTKP